MEKRKPKYPMPTKWQSFRLRHRYLFSLKGAAKGAMIWWIALAAAIGGSYLIAVAGLSLLKITQAYPFTTPISFADFCWMGIGYLVVILTLPIVDVKVWEEKQREGYGALRTETWRKGS